MEVKVIYIIDVTLVFGYNVFYKYRKNLSCYMSIQIFDPKAVSGFGIFGQETAKKMYTSLSSHSLGVSYESSLKTFTVLGSSSLLSEELEKIFSENKYQGWKPSVLKEVDTDGNHLVRLVPIIKDQFTLNPSAGKPLIGVSPAAQSDFHVVINPTRDDYASQLVYDLQSLGVSFKGRTCIDIGCRSGENTLAMQNAGAKVTGIDPNNAEFEVAIKKGMDESQLVKMTLQKYRESFPDNKFDIATVFLWNIPFRERETFVSCLKDIIHRNGLVVIGYVDEVYDKDPYINIPELMVKAFHNVSRTVFDRSLNRYVLVCSSCIR